MMQFGGSEGEGSKSNYIWLQFKEQQIGEIIFILIT